jgi:F420-non-reducing hydrogenase iron-sulfur subunit
MADFQPKIVGFLCTWCSYAGADLCGVSRYQYPPNIRLVRVMCSTRMSAHMILRLLREGADGILIGGCHLGDCHYMTGNYYTEKRFGMIQKILELAGLEPERVKLEWISASEGERFSKVVKEFIDQIREMGPSPASKNAEIAKKLEAAENASKTFRLKALVSKQYNLLSKGNVYGDIADPDKLKGIVDEATDDEFERELILTLTTGSSLSVKELSKMIDVPTDRVLDHIVMLRQRNMIAMDHPKAGEFTPTYHAIEIGGD